MERSEPRDGGDAEKMLLNCVVCPPNAPRPDCKLCRGGGAIFVSAARGG